jgi:hypothetical protein
MRIGWGKLRGLGVLLLAALGCHPTPELKPPPHPESYALPPRSDERYCRPPQYPKDKSDEDILKAKIEEANQPITPPAGPGASPGRPY